MRKHSRKFIGKLCLTAAAVAAVILLGCQAGRRAENRAQSQEPERLSETSAVTPSAGAGTEEDVSASAPEPEAAVAGSEPTPSPLPPLEQRLAELPAGTVVAEEEVNREDLSVYFQDYEISDPLFARIYGDDRSYKTYCTVPREDLRYIKLLHYGFEGEIRVGELMVNALLAEDMKAIFQELFENQYQIEKMYLVENYGADDDLSVNDNNTSCFNFRLGTNSQSLSNHAAGCAIDINPKQNPYYIIGPDGSYVWENEDAELYIDRNVPDAAERHMITEQDLCYQLFTQYGYTWGGDWQNPIDYQHFEKIVYTAAMP